MNTIGWLSLIDHKRIGMVLLISSISFFSTVTVNLLAINSGDKY
jgi:hypothetical protein